MPNALLFWAIGLAGSLGPITLQSSGEQRATYRLMGLFAPERLQELREAIAQIPDLKVVGINQTNAEVTFQFAPKKLFPDVAAERWLESLDQKLGQASRYTFRLQARRAVPPHGVKSTELHVPILDCKACALAVHEMLFPEAGVFQVVVDYKLKRVQVLHDPKQMTLSQPEELLRRRGVQVRKSP